jgi:hypothetical protein
MSGEVGAFDRIAGRVGIRAGYGLLALDLAALLWVIVESFLPQGPVLRLVDFAFGLVLGTELVLRLRASPRPWREATHPAGIADILAVSAFLLAPFAPGWGFLRSLRTLRLLRSARLLAKLRRDLPVFRRNPEAPIAAADLLVFITVMTGLVHATQHNRNPDIANWADALYFTVAALTTTGFRRHHAGRHLGPAADRAHHAGRRHPVPAAGTGAVPGRSRSASAAQAAASAGTIRMRCIARPAASSSTSPTTATEPRSTPARLPTVGRDGMFPARAAQTAATGRTTMRLSRRGLLAAPLALPFIGAARAQSGWQPTRPIQLIVGFAPGGGSDIIARSIAEAAAPNFPQPLGGGEPARRGWRHRGGIRQPGGAGWPYLADRRRVGKHLPACASRPAL